MQQKRTRGLAAPFIVTAMAAALGSAGCQDVHTFVTGEQFVAPPEESPRVEVELLVEIPDAFFDALEGENREELEQAIAERVLGLADVGMRFYPVPTSEYGRGDAHPPFRMAVTVQDLVVDIDNEMVEEEGQAPRIESSVRSLGCSASAMVEKRREDAPALVVGRGHGVAQVRVSAPEEGASAGVSYDVTPTTDEQEHLSVRQSDVLDSVEKAVLTAMRELVKPVDRELAQTGPGDARL